MRVPSTEVRLAHGGSSPYSAVVTLRGAHDLNTSTGLKAALAPLEGDLLLNLAECEFMDSTVIGLVIGKARALNRHGQYLELIVAPDSQVERALATLGVDEIITVHDHMPVDDRW
jgi:anti-anti-sigma factor